MIKVVGQEKERKIYRAKCDECGKWLEYEEEDTYIGALGGRELICPACGERVYVEQPEGIDLNSSNIEFPKHFMSPDKAKDINDAEIQKWVRECLGRAESDLEEWGHYYAGSGNTIVFVFKYEDEYDIYVTKKYWDCSIPRDNCK